MHGEPPAFGDIISIPVANPPNSPDQQEIAIQDLDEQRSNVIELGINHQDETLKFQATAYHAWLKDEILRFSPDPNVFTVGNQTGANTNNTRHYGIEVGFDWTFWQSPASGRELSDQLSILGQYTFRQHEFDGDAVFNDNDIAGVAPQLLYAELLYQSRQNWYAGINLSGAPESYPIDNANTFDVNDYLLLGARAGWQGPKWGVFLEGRNLTDEEYAADTFNVVDAGGSDQTSFFPGEGIGFNIGVKRSW